MSFLGVGALEILYLSISFIIIKIIHALNILTNPSIPLNAIESIVFI